MYTTFPSSCNKVPWVEGRKATPTNHLTILEVRSPKWMSLGWTPSRGSTWESISLTFPVLETRCCGCLGVCGPFPVCSYISLNSAPNISAPSGTIFSPHFATTFLIMLGPPRQSRTLSLVQEHQLHSSHLQNSFGQGREGNTVLVPGMRTWMSLVAWLYSGYPNVPVLL